MDREGTPTPGPVRTDRVDETPFLPRHLAAERATLGALFGADRRALAAIRHILAPRDFYCSVHAAVYAAVLALHDDGDVIDVVTVRDEMLQQGTYGRITPAHLRALADLRAVIGDCHPGFEPDASPAVHLAWIVKKKAILRRVTCSNRCHYRRPEPER